MTQINDGFAFVIDTDSYAGNFEREMTAYITGHIGECGVGDEYIEELPINFDNIIDVPDEHGCYRPTTIWPLSGTKTKYNAVAIFFETSPSQEQIDFMKERSYTFDEVVKGNIKITGFRLLEFKSKTKETKI